MIGCHSFSEFGGTLQHRLRRRPVCIWWSDASITVDRFTMWSWHLNPGPDKVKAINILRANDDEYPIVT